MASPATDYHCRHNFLYRQIVWVPNITNHILKKTILIIIIFILTNSPSHHINPHCGNTNPRMSSPVDLQVGELGKLLSTLLAGVLDQLRVHLQPFVLTISLVC